METILIFSSPDPGGARGLLAAAPGAEQLFRPVAATRFSPEAPGEEYARATVILGRAPTGMVAKAGAAALAPDWSAGVDPYLKEGGAPREGAMLTSAVGAYGQAVSEHMFATLLALCKRLHQYRTPEPESRTPLGEVKTLAGATVLVAGAGDIGSSFARLVKGMGAHTVGLRRSPERGAEGIDEMHPLSALDEWLPKADVVALVLPHSPETDRLMDGPRIGRMKRDAILLNAGRGSAVDCGALARALEEGHLSGGRSGRDRSGASARGAPPVAGRALPHHPPRRRGRPPPRHPGAAGGHRAGQPAPLSSRRTAPQPDEGHRPSLSDEETGGAFSQVIHIRRG